jgi:hypothetical protein
MTDQGLPILTVGTSMAVTITHVFLWGSSATNHIENALMGSPCDRLIVHEHGDSLKKIPLGEK